METILQGSAVLGVVVVLFCGVRWLVRKWQDKARLERRLANVSEWDMTPEARLRWQEIAGEWRDFDAEMREQERKVA